MFWNQGWKIFLAAGNGSEQGSDVEHLFPAAMAPAPVPGPTGEGESAAAAACKPEADPSAILEPESTAVPAPLRHVPLKPPRAFVAKKKQTVSVTQELEPIRAGPLLPMVPCWPSPMIMKSRVSMEKPHMMVFPLDLVMG